MSRTGKIASLSFDTREELNTRMRNGENGGTLLPWLHQFDPTINAQNLSNWRHGGYEDWLKDQARLDLIRQRAEMTRRELAAGGFDVLDKAIYDLSCRLAEADEADPIKTSYAIAALKGAVISSKKAGIDQEKLEIEREKFHLAEAKFQRDTCELFLKWYNNTIVSRILEADTPHDEKIEQLGLQLFGEDWQ
jgi:hypothetical protein